MNIKEIIAKKRNGKILNGEEIEYFVKGYTKGEITDYQAAALIMAIYINGINKVEMTKLTLEMAHSGDILDLTSISKNIIDKHSTGGIGDKITLILMPTIASLGIPVAKMSGRGLGFTGGTVDKLESIPNYKTNISISEFIKNVKKVGISLIGQTHNLAPADKKIYALRDSIACVDNMGLIASSIMSKKIAAGANKIVLDVTVGKGAFMKKKNEAMELAKIMRDIGKLSNKQTVCVLTNMNEPIGYAVGNTLEIIETVKCLKGEMPEDVKEIVQILGAYMLKLADKGEDIEENKKIILKNIENQKAYNKFVELVKNQGGDISYIEDTNKFPKAKYILQLKSTQEGNIHTIDAEKVGKVSVNLGAGRVSKEDYIDTAVGIVLNKKTGDIVKRDETLAYIHANDKEKGKQALEDLEQAFIISDKKVIKRPNIIDVVM